MMPVVPDEFINDYCKQLFDTRPDALSYQDHLLLCKFVCDKIWPEWKCITSFPDNQTYCYVSNTGLVMDHKQRPIRIYKNSSGYDTVWVRSIINPKRCYPKLVHLLVAEAFVPNPYNLPEIDHLNANQSLNWYRNLKWCTHQDNIAHAIRAGHQVVGMAHKMSRFTDDQIHEVCRLLENPKNSIRDISKKTGVSMRTITNIRFNNGWLHISGLYAFPKTKRKQGPKYAPVSIAIRDMVLAGYDDQHIFSAISKSGLSKGYTHKSIGDRIYHIRRKYQESSEGSSTIES